MLHSCQNPNIAYCVSKTYSSCTQASKNTTYGVFTDPCQPHVTCGPRPFINTISLPFLLYFRWKSILGKRISMRILFMLIFCFCDRNILYPMFFSFSGNQLQLFPQIHSKIIQTPLLIPFCWKSFSDFWKEIQPLNQPIYDSIHWHSAPDICHHWPHVGRSLIGFYSPDPLSCEYQKEIWTWVVLVV